MGKRVENIEVSNAMMGRVAEVSFKNSMDRKGLKVLRWRMVLSSIATIFRRERSERRETPDYRIPACELALFPGGVEYPERYEKLAEDFEQALKEEDFRRALKGYWELKEEDYERLRRFVRQKGYSDRRLKYHYPYRGIPDYFIVDPETKECWFAEVKSGGARLTQDQEEMIKELKYRGFKVKLYRMKVSCEVKKEEVEV